VRAIVNRSLSNNLHTTLSAPATSVSSADGRELPIARLSEGLKSLFCFSLVASVFQIEEAVKERQLAFRKRP
jgi:hypothetical protein